MVPDHYWIINRVRRSDQITSDPHLTVRGRRRRTDCRHQQSRSSRPPDQHHPTRACRHACIEMHRVGLTNIVRQTSRFTHKRVLRFNLQQLRLHSVILYAEYADPKAANVSIATTCVDSLPTYVLLAICLFVRIMHDGHLTAVFRGRYLIMAFWIFIIFHSLI